MEAGRQREAGRQAGKDLEKMKRLVEVGKQVATAREHIIVPAVSKSFV